MQSNTQILVHTGIELVVIGGVIFWFNRKLVLCQNEIDEFRTKITKYEDRITQLENILAHHDQILRKFVVENPQLSNQKQSPNLSHDIQQSPTSLPPLDVPTEYLDELLKNELDNITESRECTDDVCELKGSRLKKKNRVKKSKKQT
uniref:Uncharacterized protein n=1 Tax=Marseillevirus LCMAC102 TaxID=2506603 RepID=A0A481YVL8_9VIRU|nr:MAG: uncharacterized protein LCMAC102_03890 [Marseillevirus LCMAC102]